MMASGEPPFLLVGTDVSAKYRGAFCEAKVKKVSKLVKCKVAVKHSSQTLDVTDDQIKGGLRVGGTVEVRQDNGQTAEGTLSKVVDASMYTVVFDDGDERTLRRTQICLKGKKHFVESETLDQLPLTHPEHFGTPVMQQGKKVRKRSRSSLSGDESSDIESDSSDDDTPANKKRTYVGKLQDCIGKIVCVDNADKRKPGAWFPALVVLPSAADVPLKTKGHVVVRSFRDNRFLPVLKKETKEFTRELALKNEEKALKSSMEKALLFLDNHELPLTWNKDELLGTDAESGGSDEDTSDDEPSEEKDRFVAQLYKFMDDRGTPINKAPIVGMKDLNLYRLFRIVQNIGGYNRVTNQMKWRLVWSKMGLPASNTASTQIKAAYKKYLHAFEDFYRKLGCTMGTSSRPSRIRHGSGRSLLSFRERDKESPRSPKTDRKSGPGKDDEKARDDDDDDAKSTKSDTKSPNKEQVDEKSPREKAVTRSDEKKIKENKATEQKDKKVTEKGTQRLMKTPAGKIEKSGIKVDDKKGPASKAEEKKVTSTKTDDKKGTTKSEEKKGPAKVEERKGPREFTRSASRTEDKIAKEDMNTDDGKGSPKRILKGRMGDEKKGAKGVDETKENPKKLNKDDKKVDEGKVKKETEKKGKVEKEEGEKKSDAKTKKEDEGKKAKKTEKEDEVKNGKQVEKDEKGKKAEEKKMNKEEKCKKVEKDDVKEDSESKKGRKNMKEDEEEESKGRKEEKKTEGGKKDEVKKVVSGRRTKKDDGEEPKEQGAKVDDETGGEETKDTRKRPARKKSAAQKEWPPEDTGPVAKKAKESHDDAKSKKKEGIKPVTKAKKAKSKLGESDDGAGDDGHETDGSNKASKSKKEVEYCVGTKLKVKYGRGRNHKVYEAKVVETEESHGSVNYLVHYNGWNTRYDEWIKRERIVSRVGPPPPELADKKSKARSQSPKTVVKGIKKTTGPPLVRAQSQDSKVRKPGSPRMRPTRSNSSEMPYPIGLPPKSRRLRRMSGHTESSDVTSHVSDSDDETIDGQDETEEEAQPKEEPEVKAAAVTEDVPEAGQEEKPVIKPEQKASEEKEPSPAPSDTDSNEIKSEQMELGDTLDDIINRIGDGEEDVEKKPGKKSDTVSEVKIEGAEDEEPTLLPVIVDTEKPKVEEIKKEVADVVPDTEPKVIVVEEAAPKPESKDTADIDLSCKESLEPLVDIKKDVKAANDEHGDNAKAVIEGAGLAKGDVGVAKEAVPVTGSNVPDLESVEKVEQEEVKDGKKKKRSREDGSDGEEHEKEKKKGKKKHRVSKEGQKGDGEDQDEGAVEGKKKKRKKKDGDAEAHGEKRKKKTRKKKKELDEDSDAAKEIAKEMLKLKEESVLLPVASGAVKEQYSVSAMFSGDLCSRSPQPSHSGANLLHDLASACEKASQPRAMSSAVMDNTPPTTPEGSPTGAGSSASNISPCNEEVQSTKSEHEANIEVARYMTGEGRLEGGDSPNPCDTSIVSNCSAGSSGNVPSSESGTELGLKRKMEEAEEEPVHKKKRRSRKGKTADKKHSTKHQASDSDETPEGAIGSPLHSQDSSIASPAKKVERRSPRPSKYNFYLDESEDMERDKKIEILQERICEIRKIYMQLKAEVALIDRRRKRARRKEREAAAQQAKESAAAESSPVCS